ncbi:MAG: hypothetical protein HY904_13010 [Deltaproteobacteria bacterium]|nr:hypothetical protein [Deltaproteobacteria bacterium]
MLMRWFIPRCPALLALALLSACPPDPTGNYRGCRDDTDCLNGYRCVQSGADTAVCERRDNNTATSAPTATSAVSGGASSSAAAASSGPLCDLAQLTRTCTALGMAQDGNRCLCVAIPPAPDAGVDAGTCNPVLLRSICDALGKDTDPGACLCRDYPPDGGFDAGPNGCRVDTDCATGEFCCGLRCQPTNANTINRHCGCAPGVPGDTGVDCTTGTSGRRCMGPADAPLDVRDGGVRGLLAGAVCGCGDERLAPDDCGVDGEGLAAYCVDHRCAWQSTTQCGPAREPCSAARGGMHCIAQDGGAGRCACDANAADATAECPPLQSQFRAASRCASGTLPAPWGTCACGSGTALCVGSPTSTCCNTSGSAMACVNVTSDSSHCGMCGVVCEDNNAKGCAMRAPGTFASCAGTYSYSNDECYPGTAQNPLATTNKVRAVQTASYVYACVCDAFRAYGDESACPPGYHCCPAGVADAGAGCCERVCTTPAASNRCFTTWPRDAGTADAGP